ncbi:hypothetical protein E4U32_005757 [Claviceps aff. humidiphila group G2b]|nr:hypothetical protein E4U32_005757 [Claviceps aff. humidiphila group G2b]
MFDTGCVCQGDDIVCRGRMSLKDGVAAIVAAAEALGIARLNKLAVAKERMMADDEPGGMALARAQKEQDGHSRSSPSSDDQDASAHLLL